jgi:hypothetical protein
MEVDVMATYSEKLRDPRWQRMRLEVLECAGWACQSCQSSTKTLHVHHKQYIKGREPWEYERTNFEALCEDCHQESHVDKDLINEILAAMPSLMWQRVASLLAGYAYEHVSDDVLSRTYSAHDYEAGKLSAALSDLELSKFPMLHEKFAELMREPS